MQTTQLLNYVTYRTIKGARLSNSDVHQCHYNKLLQ